LTASKSTFSITGGVLSRAAALAINAAAIGPCRWAWRPASSPKASKTPNVDGPNFSANQAVVPDSALASGSAPARKSATAATKAAIDNFTLGLAREVADEGIRVNGVRPGIIATDIHATSGMLQRARAAVEQIPLRRMGTADEVAQAVVFLLSDAAAYVTGATLDVAGGR